MFRIIFMISMIFCLTQCHGGLFSPRRSIVEEAEELTREQQFDQAIALYQRHIENRLKVADRPDWENPYLYLLAIGDLRLRQDKVAEAAAYYDQAEKKGVGAALVADRYRGLAVHFEERHELENAIEVLKKYRHLDPLLFDGMLDRLSKQIVAEEDSSTSHLAK